MSDVGAVVLLPVSEEDRNKFEARLIGRFSGDRFKAIVTIDTEVGPVKDAMLHIIDLHDPRRLLYTDDNGRYYMRPIHSERLIGRTYDGSPRIDEVQESSRRWLDENVADWRDHQMSSNGYVCAELAIRKDHMENFVYGILM